MRRLNIFLMMALVVMAGMVSNMQAQSGLNNPLMPSTERTVFYIGPVLGYNSVDHTISTNFGAMDGGGDILCPAYEGGSANGFYIGLSGEYLLGGAKNSTSSVIFRILFNTMPSELSIEPNDAEGSGALNTLVTLRDNTGNTRDSIVASEISMYNTVSYNLLTFEAVYKLNIGDTPFGIVAGPVFDLAITSTHNEIMEIKNSDLVFKELDAEALANGYKLTDGGKKYVFTDGDIEGAAALRVALKIGAQYEFLFGKMYVVPSVYYNYGLTSLSGDWGVNAFQVGFDIRWAL